LAEALCSEYEVTSEQAIHDVTEIVAKWEKANIIE